MRPISPDRSRLQNLLHAQSIKSTKSDFYYKLNALVDKIKSYNETFNEDAKPRRRKPRKRKSSMEPMLVNDRSTLSKENRKQRKYLPTMKARGSSNFFKRGNVRKKIWSGSYINELYQGYTPVRQRSTTGILDKVYLNQINRHSSTKNVLFEDQKAAVPIPSIKPAALNSMMPISKDNEGLIKNAFPLESVQGPGGSFRFIDSVEKSPINEALSESSICSEKIGDKRQL
ncbi:unnamed protein product [Moneuplotes crassus]|uniref:Uncharacterized protein n=1 Tax=Euplotes crassus TaxID=5936 RepID=A0AAD1U4Z7_EUPCR|nr:unnamed protein product [Moneuplotes crassus]